MGIKGGFKQALKDTTSEMQQCYKDYTPLARWLTSRFTTIRNKILLSAGVNPCKFDCVGYIMLYNVFDSKKPLVIRPTIGRRMYSECLSDSIKRELGKEYPASRRGNDGKWPKFWDTHGGGGRTRALRMVVAKCDEKDVKLVPITHDFPVPT